MESKKSDVIIVRGKTDIIVGGEGRSLVVEDREYELTETRGQAVQVRVCYLACNQSHLTSYRF